MAHMHYKGTGKVHSFRGLLEDTGQRKIRIQGSVGAIAWRITKFQVITNTPGTVAAESTVKIYREQQDTVTGTIDFTEDELLGIAYWGSGLTRDDPENMEVIFDNALFVRNIWVTHENHEGSASCNYYFELEEVKVSAAGMAQLAVAAARRTID